MRISPDRLPRALSPCGKRQPGAVKQQPATQNQQSAVREKMDRQSEKHLAFLLRARESLTFHEEKIQELREFIGKHRDTTLESVREEVVAAKASVLKLEESMEKLRESVDNERMEHTFTMSALEALLEEDGSFPFKTLEEYIKSKAEGEDGEKTAKKYTAADLEKLVKAQKKSMGHEGFSKSV